MTTYPAPPTQSLTETPGAGTPPPGAPGEGRASEEALEALAARLRPGAPEPADEPEYAPDAAAVARARRLRAHARHLAGRHDRCRAGQCLILRGDVFSLDLGEARRYWATERPKRIGR